jgi:hypothetical protein
VSLFPRVLGFASGEERVDESFAAVGTTVFDGGDAESARPVAVAVTVNEYAVPLVRPTTVMGEPVPTAVAPPGDAVARYDSSPPRSAGGEKLTVARALPAVAITCVSVRRLPLDKSFGTLGVRRCTTTDGTTAFDGVEGGLSPTAFVATTVNVYGVPPSSPATAAWVGGAEPFAPATNALAPPGDAVTAYASTALPPSTDGGVQFTVACPDPGVPDTPDGGLGFPDTTDTSVDAMAVSPSLSFSVNTT